MSINTSKLVRALRGAGYPVRSHSGHDMDGQTCVGVPLKSDSDLHRLRSVVNDVVEEYDLGDPEVDPLPNGLIAYWPDAELCA